MSTSRNFPRSSPWRVVRGRRIAGILFEIDPQTGIVRIKRGNECELVDLRKFGLKPAQGGGEEVDGRQ